MMILSICDSPSALEVISKILLLIDIIKVAVPIILIIFLMIKFMRAVSSHDEGEIQKVFKSSISNMIAATLIFLIPTIVIMIARLSMASTPYSKCLVRLSSDEIAIKYYNNADSLIKKAEDSLKYSDYFNALGYLDNIKDLDKKNEYLRRLEDIKEIIDKNNEEEEEDIGGGSSSYQGNMIIVNEAKKYINKDVGTDCSGFVKHKVLKPLDYLQDDIAKTSGHCDGKSRGSYGMYLKYKEKGRVVWERPASASTLALSVQSFPGDCKPGDVIFYSYGNNDCVKHVVIYTGFEDGKHMIVDSNQQDHIVRYRAIDKVYRTAMPLACIRPIKNGE